jgi:HAD superfamily hydrolase (TIGR01509 family)
VTGRARAIAAVIFDLDGVLLDSEAAWDAARRELVADRGGTWTDTATRDMLGMSAPEWSAYVRDLGVDRTPEQINDEVVERLLSVYAERLPLIPGAVEAVDRMAARWPLGLASSSNRAVIDTVLDAAGIADRFVAWTSSEEVGPGKPAPDVFLEAARRVGADPRACAAVEDSHNGILSAHAAGMRVLAIPNHEFPPGDDALAHADRVLPGLDALTVEAVEALA